MPIAKSANHNDAPVPEIVHPMDYSSRASSLRSHDTLLSNPLTNSSDQQELRNRRHADVDKTNSSSDEFKENGRRSSKPNRRPSNAGSSSSSSQSPPPNSFQGKMHKLRKSCSGIVEDERTQIFILAMIVVNSIMFGIATFPAIKNDPTRVTAFEVCDLWFIVIFSIEIIMNLIAQGREFFKDGWLVFDLLIVVVSWISIEVYFLRAFRIFRALRLISRVELLRNVVVALFSIIPQLTAICLLLFLIFYIFAVMFTQLFKNMYEENQTTYDYFGRMDLSFFTLFQFLCLDEWSAIAYEVMEVYPWAWTIFIAFTSSSAFVVVNLLIAVICEAVHVLRNAEKAMLYGFKADDNVDDDDLDEEQLEKKVGEMQRMLDDMMLAQENMAKTIQYLSLALLPEFTSGKGMGKDKIETDRPTGPQYKLAEPDDECGRLCGLPLH